MRQRYVIKWINKFSKEEGYVGKVLAKAGHFVNSDKENAKRYPNQGLVAADIQKLNQIGEAENNDFYVLPE